jgi:hypothetical protein
MYGSLVGSRDQDNWKVHLRRKHGELSISVKGVGVENERSCPNLLRDLTGMSNEMI